MDEVCTYEGSVEDVIFFNETNAYAVFDFFTQTATLITCTGCVPYLKAGEFLRITGVWTTHPSYGEQFKITSFEKLEPSGEAEILNYLASGVIRGIRESTAKKIVDTFGADTLNILKDTPERLSEIKGISLKKAIEVGEAYRDIQSKESLILFLHKYGISTSFAIKIYDRFGDSAVDSIRVNPYILCDNFRGISFKTADTIAKSIGISENNENRIKSGMRYVLMYSAFSGGHTFLPRALLVRLSVKMLSIDEMAAENALILLLFDNSFRSEIINGEEAIFLPEYYECEKILAARLAKMVNKSDTFSYTAEKYISDIEKSSGITLAEKQRLAAKCAAMHDIVVITGGPGTGKTTTIKFIIEIFKGMNKKIAMTAPTGRAAKRMSAVTGIEARTIHRLLEINFSDDDYIREFTFSGDSPLDYDAIIVDEVSMIDVLLMNLLVDAISPGTKLILVGDSDQLPSVGAGRVLGDIISSDVIPVIRLDTVFRQAEQSMIVLNAHKINSGAYPEYNNKESDFFFVDTASSEDIAGVVKNLVSVRLPQAYGYDPMNDIQILSPMKKSLAGINNLNKILQHTLNPPSKNKAEKEMAAHLLRTGDKVMQIKNNYDIAWQKLSGDEEGRGIFNGDMGFIESIESDGITVIFDDDKRVVYKSGMLDEIELAYAITVHKSQGSEFPVIVMPAYFGAPRLMSRNLLYTAITRATNLVVLVGSRSAVRKMVDNDFEEFRYSSLCARLKSEMPGSA